MKRNRAKMRRLMRPPRTKALRKLETIETGIEAALFAQIWDKAKRKMRGTRPNGKRLQVPASLVNSYDDALIKMMRELFDRGKAMGRERTQAYRRKVAKKLKRLHKRIRELETPENAIAARQGATTVVYSSWVTKKMKEWVQKTTKQRFRRTIGMARDIMNEGIQNSWTRGQMREAMSGRFKHYKEYELDRVITTEAVRAVNLGTFQSESTDELVIGWQVVVNYTGCAICNAAEAHGFMSRNDIDGDHTPPLHPNCECTLEPVFYTDSDAVDYLKDHPEADPFAKAA